MRAAITTWLALSETALILLNSYDAHTKQKLTFLFWLFVCHIRFFFICFCLFMISFWGYFQELCIHTSTLICFYSNQISLTSPSLLPALHPLQNLICSKIKQWPRVKSNGSGYHRLGFVKQHDSYRFNDVVPSKVKHFICIQLLSYSLFTTFPNN